MSGSDDSSESSSIPSWQRPQDDQPQDTLQIARRFLDDESVKNAPRDKKVEFLKSKDVSDSDIQKLLGSEESNQQTEASVESEATKEREPKSQLSPASSQSKSLETKDRPPVVTYPEFLSKPERPPPLVTTDRLVGALYGFAGVSTLVYGLSKYLVAPMVETLNESRSEYHDITSKKLNDLVAQLEKTVSVVPPAANAQSSTPSAQSPDLDDEDPAEMFHRDIGTQTSLPATPAALQDKKEPAALTHANQLAKLTRWTAGLRDDVRGQSSSFGDMKTEIDAFRNDLDTMTYAQHEFSGTSYEMFGGPKKNEPNDELRKVRDNIRRIKGVLLSTRSFPASTR